MGKAVNGSQGSAASGDGGELLQEGFLAERVESQVPPDIGTNGTNLGKGWGNWESRGREKTVHYKRQRAVPEALG